MTITDRSGGVASAGNPTMTDRRTGIMAGIAIKAPCRAASTAALTLSGEQTVDGVACVAGDRVLVKNQSTTSQNGIYVVSTGLWTRATDFDSVDEIAKGTIVYVAAGGAVNGDTLWAVSSADPVTIESSAITYSNVSRLLVVPSTDNAIVRFNGTTGNLQDSGVIVDDSNNVSGIASEWVSKAVTASPTDAGGSTPSVNLHRVTSDNVDAGTGFILGHQSRYTFGGSSVKGGRIASYDFVANTAITNASNANRNYVAHVGVAYTAVGDGGSDTSSNAKGGYFGGNPSVHLDAGGTNVFHAAGQEVDITLSTGSSARYATGQFIAGFNAVRGSEVDAALAMSGGTGHIGWKHGILWTDISRGTTENPFYASSTVMGTVWLGSVPTVDLGIDFGDGSTTGINFTSFAYRSKGFSVSGAGAVRSDGSIKSTSATGGVGYAIGAGGTVTQGSGAGKATAVGPFDKACGAITMNNAALAAATIVSFTLTNSAIAATDVLVLNHISGGTVGAYTLNAQAGAGSATINVRNNTAGSLSDAIVIQFAVIKGVNA